MKLLQNSGKNSPSTRTKPLQGEQDKNCSFKMPCFHQRLLDALDLYCKSVAGHFEVQVDDKCKFGARSVGADLTLDLLDVIRDLAPAIAQSGRTTLVYDVVPATTLFKIRLLVFSARKQQCTGSLCSIADELDFIDAFLIRHCCSFVNNRERSRGSCGELHWAYASQLFSEQSSPSPAVISTYAQTSDPYPSFPDRQSL